MKIPANVFDQHSAFLGKTRSGKTYALRGIVEGFLDAGDRVCIIDPKGDWWGLRSSASGKSAGYPVVVFGGEHADVPIDGHSGGPVGELICSGNRPAVIDLSTLGVGERTRFFGDFAAVLFRHNKGRLRLVIDEFHNFAPQGKVMNPEAGMMLHWANRLASEGSGKGIILCMASQRPQKVAKDSLTCAETLFAFRVIHKLDRDADKEWLDGAGDKGKATKIMDELASMPRGTAWVWSPEIGFYEKVVFPKIKTFDSMKPAEPGEAPPSGWADVNIEDVKAKLVETVKVAEANDPKKLQARIRELEKQVFDGAMTVENATDLQAQKDALGEALAHRDVLELKLDKLQTLVNAANARMDVYARALDGLMTRMDSIRELTAVDPEGVLEELRKVSPPADELHHEAPSQAGAVRPPDRGPRPREAQRGPAIGPAPSAATDLSGPHERILDAITWWQSIGVRAPNRVQVGFVAGYTATSGTFRNRLAELRAACRIEYAGDTLVFTPGGAGGRTVRRPTKLSELHDMIRGRLSGPQLKLFACIVSDGRGRELTRTHVAESTGYEASSGTFRNRLAEMKGLGLIKYPKHTTVQASPLLFPEGLR